jgi:hypothetical protein
MITQTITKPIAVSSGKKIAHTATTTSSAMKKTRWPSERTRFAQSSGKRVSSSVRAARMYSSWCTDRRSCSRSERATR